MEVDEKAVDIEGFNVTSATRTLMLRVSFPTRSSGLNSSDDDEVVDGSVAGGKRMNDRSTHPNAPGELLSQIIRELDSG